MLALETKNLAKTYRGGLKALMEITLSVEEGDFFGLLGPNGAGKSTTIGIISSLVNRSSGTVNVFGKDLDADPSFAKASIGIVPQEFNFNIFEKVMDIIVSQAGYYGIGRKKASKRGEFLLKKLSLWGKSSMPAHTLSGGMKRKLMIARALVHEPRLLILDEPTAGVDVETRREMWSFIRQINRKGTTIILTTHNFEEAERLCRNIAIIDKGRIIENTSMKNLLSKLDRQSFVLDIKNPLARIPENPFRMKMIDSRTLQAELSEGQCMNSLFRFMEDNRIRVMSMTNKTNRLEALFISLLGKGNRPETHK
ncbi:MAG: ABC transporter ATP-binding protein [archaeon]